MYALIGDGRVARHFSHYFDFLEIPYRSWARGSDGQASQLNGILEETSHVLLLIKDSAIEPFIGKHKELDQKTLIHFSGSLVTPLAAGAHPLMTFNEQLYPVERYLEIPFVIERNRGTMESLLPGLENPCWYINPDDKPFYHALCVLSGNFTCLLWDKTLSEFESRFDFPAEIAFPYLRQICRNLQNRGVPPLTGPLVRRDLDTIEKNLKALDDDPYQRVYEGFLRALELYPEMEDSDDS